MGGSIPLAVGAALAARMRGCDAVAVPFFGDAATEEGVFHESVSFAALRQLPGIAPEREPLLPHEDGVPLMIDGQHPQRQVVWMHQPINRIRPRRRDRLVLAHSDPPVVVNRPDRLDAPGLWSVAHGSRDTGNGEWRIVSSE